MFFYRCLVLVLGMVPMPTGVRNLSGHNAFYDISVQQVTVLGTRTQVTVPLINMPGMSALSMRNSRTIGLFDVLLTTNFTKPFNLFFFLQIY